MNAVIMESVLRMLPVTSDWMQHRNELCAALTSDVSETGRISALMLTSQHPVGHQSLLFQCAMTSAVEGLSVVYICQHPFTSLPRLVHGLPSAQPSALKSVNFVYCVTADELISYCASIHLQSNLPDLIIIDDLHLYTHQITATGAEQALAKMFALLMDVMDYIQLKNTESSCRLVVSMSEESSNVDLKSLAQRFHFTTATVRPGSDKEVNGMYTLRVMENNKRLECTYQIKPDAIYLREAAISQSIPDT